jgi:hypothetical protein
MSAVGDTVYWRMPDGYVASGVLLATTGQGKHATAKVKLDGGGTTNVQLVKLRPTKQAAQTRTSAPQSGKRLGTAFVPARRAVNPPKLADLPPQPVPVDERILATLQLILEAVTPDEPDPDAIPWLVPDVQGAKGHDVLGGTGPGGAIKKFARSKDRVRAPKRMALTPFQRDQRRRSNGEPP